MRFSLLIGVVLVAAFASPAFACVESEMVEVDGYYWVSVCDSSSCGGHWQYGVIGYYSSCDDSGGYSGGSGSGTGGTSGITALQNAYTNHGCDPVPIAAQILDENGYDQTGMQNYFAFADWKDGASGFVLVD